MYQNNLTQRYQSYANQPINYMNNQMFTNNPAYASNIYDQNFYQQMMMQREEQMRKIRNINDLGLTKEQITEYVIAPIRVEKGDSSELTRSIDEEREQLTKGFIEKNWWSQRTNAPYKNILKDLDWKKDFKTQDDLIVHKYTDLDKVGLMDDYKALVSLIEKHNGQLKVIFSLSKENEHKKAFKFVQKYQYRLKYNPKDYNDLKDYYKNAQKKFDRDQRKLDDVINKLMDEEIKIDDEDLKRIESEFLKPSKTKKSKTREKDREKEIDRQLQELIDEYGEEILKELEEDSDDEKREKEKDKKSKRTKPEPRKQTKHDSDDETQNKQEKIRIKRPTKTTKSDSDSDESDNDTSTRESQNNEAPKIRIKRVVKQSEITEKASSRNKHDDDKDTKTKNDTANRIRIKRIGREADTIEPSKSSSTVDRNDKKIDITKNKEDDIQNKKGDNDDNVKRIRIVRKPKTDGK
jgi:hypothetical protein